MTRAEPAAPANAARGRGEWAALLAAATCLLVIFWMGLGWDALTLKANYVGKKTDYYSSLVHGFQSGHLYLDRKPDPRLDSPDPATYRMADKLLDASYHNHHFYLYFGATPAALILLPYALVTGSDLEPRFVVFLSVSLGFLLAVAIWRMLVSDRAPGLGAPLRFLGVVAFAFAPATVLLITRSMFYEVAIATGYACVMAGAFWMYRALSGRGRAEVQLAAASLFLGLAGGCRPDLVLAVPALAIAAFALAWWGRDREPLSRGLGRYGTAAVIPAALVGACIAVYNFERFGSPFDFGFKYSQNAFTGSGYAMGRAGFFWSNVRWDYLTLPALSPYFPYVFPEGASFRPKGYYGAEAIHGQFPVFLLVAFVGLSAIALRRRLRVGRTGAYLAAVGWMFLAPFVALSFLGLRADRYMVDYQPSLVLAFLLLGALVAASLARGAGRALWILAFGVLTLGVAAFNVFAGIQQFDAFKDIRYPSYRMLETLGNVPSYWAERLGLLRVGPVEFKVIFPRDVKVSKIEPLVSLGTPDTSDALYVIEHEGGHEIEFMDDHHDYGGHRSAVLAIEPGKTYTLRLDMGSFYPPLNHPYFKNYDVLQRHIAKTRLSLEMDGVVVLRDMMNAYDAPPWSLEIGRNDITLKPYNATFSGPIFGLRRLAPPPPEFTPHNNGLWRIRCTFPMDTPNRRLPLLSMGLTGEGTLLLTTIFPNNVLSFTTDEWGVHGATSANFTIDPVKEHLIEVFVGSLAAGTEWPKDWGVPQDRLAAEGHMLRVWMDGKAVWETQLVREADPLDSFIDVGTNLQDFSSAETYFFGPIRSDPFSNEESREFLSRNLSIGR